MDAIERALRDLGDGVRFGGESAGDVLDADAARAARAEIDWLSPPPVAAASTEDLRLLRELENLARRHWNHEDVDRIGDLLDALRAEREGQ